MRNLFMFIAGMALGAASWGLGAMLSGRFEPFDSLTGFLLTQCVLGGAALVVGIRLGGCSLLSLVLGAYLGLNLHAYAFGGSEARAWVWLGAVTTVALIMLPLLAGIAGVLFRRSSRRVKGMVQS